MQALSPADGAVRGRRGTVSPSVALTGRHRFDVPARPHRRHETRPRFGGAFLHRVPVICSRCRDLAEQGDALAENTGKGIVHDDTQALMWFYLAAHNGSKEALESIDSLSLKMSPSLEQAKALAAAWKPNHPHRTRIGAPPQGCFVLATPPLISE